MIVRAAVCQRMGSRSRKALQCHPTPSRGLRTVPTLIVGRTADAEVPLRAIERSGRPVSCHHPLAGQEIRGGSILGDTDDVERVIIDPTIPIGIKGS
jgi:hypothetical protein